MVSLGVLVPFDVEVWLRRVLKARRQLGLLQGCFEDLFDRDRDFLFVAFVWVRRPLLGFLVPLLSWYSELDESRLF